MAHGTPDWGVTAGAVTTYQLTDLAELAARLGSIVTFDRRGDVIFLEDFESGLHKWSTLISGTGATVDLSSNRARTGRYSAHLVAGSSSSRFAEMMHYLPFPVLSSFGLECGFQLGGADDNLNLRLRLFDGANLREYQVRYVSVPQSLQYLDSTGSFVTFAIPDQLMGQSTLFFVAKLVIDATAGEYLRFILDQRSYPLAGIAAQTIASADYPHLEARLRNTGFAGFNNEMFIDTVILTQNEPA